MRIGYEDQGDEEEEEELEYEYEAPSKKQAVMAFGEAVKKRAKK